MKIDFKQAYETCNFTKEEMLYILKHCDDENISKPLFYYARLRGDEIYGKEIYMRGLVEFSNYCHNDCYYCGIRCSNQDVQRYRLTMNEIMACFDEGYALGFRSFVLQSGEDLSYRDDDLCTLIKQMKNKYPDCALTLSIGEKSYEAYRSYKEAGADRFLLRHETINEEHYCKLHPSTMSYKQRIQCLNDLKSLGYQVGCGIMVDSPFQQDEDIVADLCFMKEFKPHMIGIGPFIPHHATPFKDYQAGKVNKVLVILGMLRIMLPNVLLPATTALGTLDEEGREKGILAGCNVLMPNLSPISLRKQYSLYDNKISSGAESAQGIKDLNDRLTKIGYHLVSDRGDYKGEI